MDFDSVYQIYSYGKAIFWRCVYRRLRKGCFWKRIPLGARTFVKHPWKIARIPEKNRKKRTIFCCRFSPLPFQSRRKPRGRSIRFSFEKIFCFLHFFFSSTITKTSSYTLYIFRRIAAKVHIMLLKYKRIFSDNTFVIFGRIIFIMPHIIRIYFSDFENHKKYYYFDRFTLSFFYYIKNYF